MQSRVIDAIKRETLLIDTRGECVGQVNGLSVTDLARYERRFNGFKSDYRGENVGYTMFAAETAEAFNRDDIRGDGTSGPYRLSDTPIIVNSDKVRIETPRGDTGYWIGPAGGAADAGPGTDFYAVEHARASVRPLQVDLTFHTQLARLPDWLRR